MSRHHVLLNFEVNCIQSRQLGTVKMLRARGKEDTSAGILTEENLYSSLVGTTTDDNELEEGSTIPKYTKKVTYNMSPCTEDYINILSHYQKLS